MGDFDAIELRRLDLTLLLVFEEAMASGKLAAVAKRLGLTQSAISHALKRLREIFNDELFIRTSHGIQPTQRALALRAPLAEALRLVAHAVSPPRFDPATDLRVFRIAALDNETALFAPLLPDPGTIAARFIFRPLIREQAIAALQAGEVDVSLGYQWQRGAGCEHCVLFEEDYMVAARSGHPILARRLTLSAYAAADHALVSPGGTLSGIVDHALAERGRSRRVVVAVPYALAIFPLLTASDLIATLPRRLAKAHAAAFGLVLAPPPLSLRRFPVQMVWHRRSAADPALAWLRARIMAAAARIG